MTDSGIIIHETDKKSIDSNNYTRIAPHNQEKYFLGEIAKVYPFLTSDILRSQCQSQKDE